MRRTILLFSLFLFSQLLAAGDNKETRAFKIAFGEKSVPWSWLKDGQPTGILIDIVNEALISRMNTNVEFYFYPWKRAQKNVKEGITDALITNYDGNRKEYTIASKEPITHLKRMIFVNINDPLISEIIKAQSLSDLRSYTIGSNIGVSWAKKTYMDYNVEWGGSVSQTLKMLEGGRFNVYIANPVSTKYKLKFLNINNVIMLPNQLSDVKTSRYKLLINNNSAHRSLIPEFDRTILAMKKDGTLEAIFKRYQ